MKAQESGIKVPIFSRSLLMTKIFFEYTPKKVKFSSSYKTSEALQQRHQEGS
jgi:hypothetical protein